MAKQPVLLTGLLLLFIASVYAEEKLFWHSVRLDKDGKLLAWTDSQSPYDRLVCSAWNAFKNIPVQSNGYKTYFAYPVFYGPKDTNQQLYAGRDWTHNPCSLFAMLTDGAMLYYSYSGDEGVMPLIRAMLDHFITHGSTQKTDAWSQVPYASSDGGSLEYRGATDSHYVQDEKYLGRGDGVGYIEPDKVGELGLAYFRFYQYCLEEKYLAAATHCADALVKHIRPGDQSHSPWPFRVDAKTGIHNREEYTFDKKSTELFKLSKTPKAITAGIKSLSLDGRENGYIVKPSEDGGFIVQIHHNAGNDVIIDLDDQADSVRR